MITLLTSDTGTVDGFVIDRNRPQSQRKVVYQVVYPVSSMYDDLKVVRYPGGSGGEFLAWFIDLLCGATEEAAQWANRRISHTDFTNNAFMGSYIWDSTRERFPALTKERWIENDPSIIDAVFADLFNAAPKIKRNTFKTHNHVLRNKLRLMVKDAIVIDCLPRQKDIWITTALLHAKIGWTRVIVPEEHLSGRSYKRHPQYDVLVSDFKERGWVPFYQLDNALWRREDEDIFSVYTYIFNMFSRKECQEHFPLEDTSYIIDAADLVVNPELTEFRNLAEFLGKPFPEESTKIICQWVSRNTMLLEKLKLWPAPAENMTPDEQIALLTDRFGTYGYRLLEMDKGPVGPAS